MSAKEICEALHEESSDGSEEEDEEGDPEEEDPEVDKDDISSEDGSYADLDMQVRCGILRLNLKNPCTLNVISYILKDLGSDDDHMEVESCEEIVGESDDEDEDGAQQNAPLEIVQAGKSIELSSDYEPIVKKVRDTAKLFKRSPVSNDNLQRHIKATREDLPNGLNLILDVRTRWNAMLAMLKRAYKIRYVT